MYCEFFNETLIKHTRKDHRCFGCGKVIHAGSRCYYHTGKFEGEFFADHICLPCRKHLYKYRENFEDGYGFGDIRDDRIETVRQWQENRRIKVKKIAG